MVACDDGGVAGLTTPVLAAVGAALLVALAVAADLPGEPRAAAAAHRQEGGHPPAAAPGVAESAARNAGSSERLRPPIIQRRIPYPRSRKKQMAAYSARHYREPTWRLNPRGIVEHYTATRSLRSVVATFRANSPDAELGEYPGVCTHYVIDADGRIYQLVSTRIRCRHTVGLNHRMIGVEHVGTSDAEVMANRRQRRSSLRLSTWLVHRFGLSTGDVIGHSESTRSRFHLERYRPWRCQTHGDFSRATMRRYRELLSNRVARSGGDTSAPRWSRSGCG